MGIGSRSSAGSRDRRCDRAPDGIAGAECPGAGNAAGSLAGPGFHCPIKPSGRNLPSGNPADGRSLDKPAQPTQPTFNGSCASAAEQSVTGITAEYLLAQTETNPRADPTKDRSQWVAPSRPGFYCPTGQTRMRGLGRQGARKYLAYLAPHAVAVADQNGIATRPMGNPTP